MRVPLAAFALFAALPAAAQSLPELHIDAADGGSVLRVRNNYTQTLDAFLIEMVDYPGSSFSFWEDGNRGVIPGAEARIPITNMTVGAAPEYVKMQAAIYEDGTTAGSPAKVAELIERRRVSLQVTRELIDRLKKAPSADAAKAGLQQWLETIPMKGASDSLEAARRSTSRTIIGGVISKLDSKKTSEILSDLHASEKRLVKSKPPL